MTRKSYSLEFKQEAVRLVQEESMSPARVARDLGLDRSSVRAWCKAAQEGRLGSVRSPTRPMTADEELAQLRKEVRILREEREILKKAAVDSTRHRNTRLLGE